MEEKPRHIPAQDAAQPPAHARAPDPAQDPAQPTAPPPAQPAEHIPALTPAPTPRTRTTWCWPLVVIATGFALLGVAINVFNAWNGNPVETVLPAGMGILAEGVIFVLPAWSLSLPFWRRILAWGFVAFFVAFALLNSLRMASVTAADTMQARADRHTEGVARAEQDVRDAEAARDKACRRGPGLPVCSIRQFEVNKVQSALADARKEVRAGAAPYGADFSALVSWASLGQLHPDSHDFDMAWLLFRTLLPTLGGLVLMLARREV